MHTPVVYSKHFAVKCLASLAHTRYPKLALMLRSLGGGKEIFSPQRTHTPRTPTCAQEFRNAHAHTLYAQSLFHSAQGKAIFAATSRPAAAPSSHAAPLAHSPRHERASCGQMRPPNRPTRAGRPPNYLQHHPPLFAALSCAYGRVVEGTLERYKACNKLVTRP